MSADLMQEAIRRLVDAVVQQVEARRRQGALAEENSPYEKVEVIGAMKGSGLFQTEGSLIWKRTWQTSDHLRLMECVKNSPEHAACMQLISGQTGKRQGTVESWLHLFVFRISYKVYDHPNQTEWIDADVQMFLDDIYMRPVKWSVYVPLTGVKLENEQYELIKDVRLRRLCKEDYESESPWPAHLIHGDGGMSEMWRDAVLELEVQSVDGGEIQMAVENYLDVLRLYSIGSVYSLFVRRFPASFTRFGGTYYRGQHYRVLKPSTLSDSDVVSLQSLLVTMRPFMPLDPTLNSTPQIMSSLAIAFQRYKGALLDPIPFEGVIAAAVSCLEALFLTGSESGELAYRLSLRTARLAGYAEYPLEETFRIVKRAYIIRSKYVHGATIDAELQMEALQIWQPLLELCRISLVIQLQLRAGKREDEKNSLIEELDKTLLDSEVRDRLGAKINSQVYLPTKA